MLFEGHTESKTVFTLHSEGHLCNKLKNTYITDDLIKIDIPTLLLL